MKLELLLEQISNINKRYNEIAQVTGENFNIFNILKIERKEDMHSKFIAMLLDPLGAHGKGDVFLKLFLKEIKIEDFPCENARVTTEKFIGFDPTHESGGRVDITISNDKNKRIFIENKIDSGEHGNQMYRYSKEDPHVLLYLTLDGHRPENSRGLIKKYESISYKEHIINWLKECIKETANSSLLRETLRQYIILIEQLTGQARSKQMENEMIDVITRDEETLSAYFCVRALPPGNKEIAKKIISAKCIPAIKQVAERNGLELQIPCIDEAFEYNDWGFYFWKQEWKTIKIAFPFDINFLGLWYGFWNESMPEEFVLELKKKGFEGHAKDRILYKPIEDKYSDWTKPNVLIELCRPDNDVIKTIEEKIKKLLEIVKDRGEYL
jgi:hypothetical protein